MQKSSTSPFGFILRILAVGAVLVACAYLLSSGFNLRLGFVLFALGFLSMGIGNMVSLPARRYERRNGIRHFTLFKLPAPEEYIAGRLFTAKHAANFCSFENALLLAGFIILLVGLFILF